MAAPAAPPRCWRCSANRTARLTRWPTASAARSTVLRSARLEVGGDTGEVRIRNLSATGVMIDGVDFPEEAVGAEVRIELVEEEMFPAVIRWVDEGRAGLEFTRHFDMERLSPAQPRTLRKAG